MSMPGRSTLLKWLRHYDRYGIKGLIDRKRPGNRKLRLPAEVHALMARYAGQFASRERPTVTKLYGDLCKDIDKRNKDRIGDKLPKPSYDRFRDYVNELDEFTKVYGRQGPLSAQNRFRMSNGGEPVTAILDVVEIDTWMIDVISLAPDDIARIAPWLVDHDDVERLWVCAAVDARSTAVLGLAFSDQADTHATFECLRMLLRDKTILQERYGCETPFDLFGRPRVVRMDGGSEFSGPAWEALASMGIIPQNPPAGKPWLRAHIENLFGGFSNVLMSRMVGRTFQRGAVPSDDDPASRAALNHDEVAQICVIYACDIYNGTARRDLDGLSPAAVWYAQREEFGVPPPPDLFVQRNVLGHTFERTLDHRGVLVDGVWYNSRELNDKFKKAGEVKLTVRIDPWDIGMASVEVDTNQWIEAPALDETAVGKSRADWLRRQAAIRVLTKKNVAEGADRRARAEERIDRLVDSAAKRSLVYMNPPDERHVELASKQTSMTAGPKRRDESTKPPKIFERPAGPTPLDRAAASRAKATPHRRWKIEDK